MIGWLLRWREERHYLDRGRLRCPRFGDIDVERCLRCPLVLDVVSGDQPHVRCYGLSPDVPDVAPVIGG